MKNVTTHNPIQTEAERLASRHPQAIFQRKNANDEQESQIELIGLNQDDEFGHSVASQPAQEAQAPQSKAHTKTNGQEFSLKVALDPKTHQPTSVEIDPNDAHSSHQNKVNEVEHAAVPVMTESTPEETAAMQSDILEQLEAVEDLPTKPMVPAAVVQEAYGMELIPKTENENELEPQPVHLEPMQSN